jgi:solute carrier family 35 protein E3
LGGFVAAVINLTQFLIIGSTSVLSFNVVGIVKTVLTLILAWWSEGKVVQISDLLGVFLAVGGSFAYAQIRV